MAGARRTRGALFASVVVASSKSGAGFPVSAPRSRDRTPRRDRRWGAGYGGPKANSPRLSEPRKAGIAGAGIDGKTVRRSHQKNGAKPLVHGRPCVEELVLPGSVGRGILSLNKAVI